MTDVSVANQYPPRMTFVALLLLTANYTVAIFLFVAGFMKLNEGWAFSQTIANYHLLPAQLNQIVAVVLPWVEVTTALMLALFLWHRAAAIIACVLFSVFGVAVISALARGLDIECGCFGTASAVKLGVQTLLLDLVLLGMSLLLCRVAKNK